MKYSLQNTIERFQKKEKIKFLFFWGHTAKDQITKTCFSQWYPCRFEENGITYKTAEHFMMAEKARLFNDQENLDKILASGNPKQAKSLGRKVKNFDPVVWDQQKYDLVKRGNLLKFSQNEKLKEFLLATGNKIIVEASPYDKIWRIGMLESDNRAENPLQWNGQNLLGFALMEVRDELKG
ncbi:NADAR family protein [Chryseobacterium sp. CT-SW4]|uniref:NADAR family protein n=1 Tax=Chryseobacterium sp. SW-1 TaxID=3157343 RepID=UPI003B015C20